MVHRPRRLFRQRRLLEFLSPRAGPQPRLPLGRGRPLGHYRPRVPAVLRLGAVEQPRFDSQGTPFRADQSAGQPRRRCQGMLLLHRLHADALLDGGHVPLSAGPLSLRTTGGRKRPTRAATAGIRARRYGRAGGEPLFRRPRRVRQGRTERHSHRDHGDQPRAGRRPAAPAAHALVPQHLELGLPPRRLLAQATHRAGRRSRHARTHRYPRHAGALPFRGRRRIRRHAVPMALHRQRDEQPPTVQHREPGTVHQGRFPSSCHRGRGGRGQSAQRRHQGGRLV